MKNLFTFSDDPLEPQWVAVNDGVMGGRSSGGPMVKDGTLHFRGELSLKNNGGFSSVRTVGYSVDLSDFGELALRVRGDGRRYQLRLSTDAEHRGIAVSYGAEFAPPATEWTVLRIRLDALQPSVRGTLLRGPPFNPAQIRQFGLLIADKREGPFALAVDWIGAE